jgi:hypothetical protein
VQGRAGRPGAKDAALSWGDLARTRVREKSAEAIVVKRLRESVEERRAEGVSAKLEEGLAPRSGKQAWKSMGRDNYGRYPGSKARPTVKPVKLKRRDVSGGCGGEPERKQCTKI